MISKASRRLLIESLEDRSLLSANFGGCAGLLLAASGAAEYSPSGQTAAAATQLVLMLPPCVPSGIPVQVTAFAVDAQNQPVSTFSDTAVLTSTDTSATSSGTALPINVTFVNGRASFPVTFAASGTQSLTLTDSTASLTVTASTTVLAAPSPTPISNPTPSAATQLVLLLPPTVPSGLPVQVMAIAENANSQPVPSYSGTATLSIANGSATLNGTVLPASVTFIHGQAQFSLVFTASGSPTLTLTDSTNSISGTAQVTVVAAPSPTPIPTPAAATQLVLHLPSTVPSGVPVWVQAVAEDANNNPAPSYAGTATLGIANGTATLNGRRTACQRDVQQWPGLVPIDFHGYGHADPDVDRRQHQFDFGFDYGHRGRAPSPTPSPTPVAATHLVLLLPPNVPSNVPVWVQAVAEARTTSLLAELRGYGGAFHCQRQPPP